MAFISFSFVAIKSREGELLPFSCRGAMAALEFATCNNANSKHCQSQADNYDYHGD